VIVNPADTWSNLAYIAFGLWMMREARRGGRRDLALFGPASIAVGVFSGAYHASYTWMLQFFDFVGMFLFCFLVLTRNAERLGWIGAERRLAFYLGGVAGMSALVPLLFEAGLPIQGLVLALILVMVGQEAVLWRREGGRAPYRHYLGALALPTAAAVCSLLDVTRVWCDPTNHWIQGHAAWHLLSAASLVMLFRFYEEGRLKLMVTSLPPLERPVFWSVWMYSSRNDSMTISTRSTGRSPEAWASVSNLVMNAFFSVYSMYFCLSFVARQTSILTSGSSVDSLQACTMRGVAASTDLQKLMAVPTVRRSLVGCEPMMAPFEMPHWKDSNSIQFGCF
jgi:hypothetical protein